MKVFPTLTETDTEFHLLLYRLAGMDVSRKSSADPVDTPSFRMPEYYLGHDE
jgi:DNA-binding GntR family transcriptional regulator